jgi:beta-lactam-binding protein with PASTA domain
MTESGDTEPDDGVVRLGERYELGGLLGRGGMADVRVGRDLRLGRTVAVKQLRGDLSADDTFQARFRREAQSSAALNHPSIVAVYDTGESIDKHGSHVPYIVMEYVEGQTLRDIMRGAENGRKILPERALSITADILSALDYSHRSGIIHRDIKPANVMLTPAGQVKVMDFGIARAIADTSSAMTQTAAVIGTAQYLSPEQARGETVDARSDIYSTGCLLYELLTGRPPFIGDSPVSVAYQHVREEAKPPSQLNPDVSQAIDNIVAKSLAKRVDDRYESAAAMRKDIELVLAGHAVAPPTTTTGVVPGATQVAPAVAAAAAAGAGARRATAEPEEDQDRSGKWWAIGALAVVLIAAIVGVLWFTDAFSPDPPPPPKQVEVQNVTGQTVDVATRALENDGLIVGKQTPQPSSEVEEGQVIETDPAAGTEVDEGSTVDLVVSSGPETVPVPLLTGYTYDRAKETLEGLGLKVEKVLQDSDAPRDQVINTDPFSGKEVPVGETVKLIVSRGEATVPSLVGMTIDQAKDTLDKLQLKYTINEDPNSTEQAGTVTSQEPISGERVPIGSTVTLTVSSKPDTPTPPAPTTPLVDGDSDGDTLGG